MSAQKRFFKVKRDHSRFNTNSYAVYHPDGHIVCCMVVDHNNKDVDFVEHDIITRQTQDHNIIETNHPKNIKRRNPR